MVKFGQSHSFFFFFFNKKVETLDFSESFVVSVNVGLDTDNLQLMKV